MGTFSTLASTNLPNDPLINEKKQCSKIYTWAHWIRSKNSLCCDPVPRFDSQGLPHSRHLQDTTGFPSRHRTNVGKKRSRIRCPICYMSVTYNIFVRFWWCFSVFHMFPRYFLVVPWCFCQKREAKGTVPTLPFARMSSGYARPRPSVLLSTWILCLRSRRSNAKAIECNRCHRNGFASKRISQEK